MKIRGILGFFSFQETVHDLAQLAYVDSLVFDWLRTE